jgi:WXG100 family type VII secretion target
MPTKKHVDTIKLHNAATKIREISREFKATYEGLYNATNDLSSSYIGDASKAFNTRMENYRNDFTACDKALESFTNFVDNYATNLEKTEEDLKAEADRM